MLTMTWQGDNLLPAPRVSLGFIVDTERGAVAPVIDDVVTLSLRQLSQTRRELAEAARAYRLKPDDLQGGYLR
jgi:pyruvate dehydrogenase E2 component (dihydrolipoamide acetyltransferase)